MQMDIGLLVINAGVIQKGKLSNASLKEVQALMDVNMYHPTAMLKKFLPRLKKREKQCGIVVVSSTAGSVALPGLATYAASKSYVSYLATAVEAETKAEGTTNVDFQILAPMFVATQMINSVLIFLKFLFVSSTTDVVCSSLRQLGHPVLPGELPITTGTANHDIVAKSLQFVQANTPMFISKLIVYFQYHIK